jgi:hypothetical protein
MISLAKALKIKNRLVGELASLQAVARQHNSLPIESRGEKSVSLDKVWEDIQNTSNRIVELKSKIAVATAQIAPFLVDLAETKSTISFLETLPIKEGKEDTQIGYGVNSSLKTVVWNSFIDEASKNKLVKENKNRLDLLQDKIDEFNAVTKIDFV